MIKRNVLKFIAVITLTPFFYSCSSGDAGDDTINPPQETLVVGHQILQIRLLTSLRQGLVL